MFSRAICFLTILAAAAASDGAEPAIWVIREKDAAIYLVGTVHLLRHQDDWNKTKLERAVGESGELWLEIADFDDQSAALPLIQKYGFDRKRSLSSKLNADQKDKLNRLAAQFGISHSVIEPMQPWMAGLMFAEMPLEKAGYDPKAGVDRLLKTEAQKKNEPVRGLETAEQQIRYLAELPEEDQVALLDQAFDDASEGITKLNKLAAAWATGDMTTVDKLVVEEIQTTAPTVYQRLLVDRNVRWSEKIAELLKSPGTKLVAVGVGHLAGPDSVQAQLVKRGINPERF